MNEYNEQDLEELLRLRLQNRAGTPLVDGLGVDTSFVTDTMGIDPSRAMQPEYPMEFLGGLARGAESVTDAPRRAAMAAGMQGENPLSAFASQFAENPDDAPTQSDLNDIAKLRLQRDYPQMAAMGFGDVAGVPDFDVPALKPVAAIGEIKGVIQGGKPFFEAYEATGKALPKLGLARAEYLPRKDVSEIGAVFEKNLQRRSAMFEVGSLPKNMILEKPAIKSGNSLLVDTYGHMDVHNAPLTVSGKKYTSSNDVAMPSFADLNKIEKSIKSHNGPIVLGNNVDPFMWSDKKHGQTKAILPLLKGKDATIKTRSDLIAHNDYINLVKDSGAKVEIVLPPFVDDELVRMSEPGAPSIKRRILAGERLKSAGIPVKYIIQNPEQYVKNIDSKKIGFDPSELLTDQKIKKANDLEIRRLIKEYKTEE